MRKGSVGWVLVVASLLVSCRRLTVTAYLYGVSSRSPGNTWAVGEAGVILRGDGASWSLLPIEQSTTLNGVWAAGADDMWAVGKSGLTLRCNSSGCSRFNHTTKDLSSVWGHAPDDVWAVGGDGHITHWDGSLWSPANSPVSYTLLSVSGTGAADV